MNIGIVVVGHCSNTFRPNGDVLLRRFITSVLNSNLNYHYELHVIDNGSIDKLLDSSVDQHMYYTYIPDQSKSGLSGAWNIGITQAYLCNADIIIISNDDVEFNSSINALIEYINDDETKDDTIYGPVSNGILSGVQRANQPTYEIHDLTNNLTNMVNGFCFAFTRKFYQKYTFDICRLFDDKNHLWGGNEEEFQKRIWSMGARSVVVGSCFIYHNKIRGWKQHI